jgi:hypothetical protein
MKERTKTGLIGFAVFFFFSLLIRVMGAEKGEALLWGLAAMIACFYIFGALNEPRDPAGRPATPPGRSDTAAKMEIPITRSSIPFYQECPACWGSGTFPFEPSPDVQRETCPVCKGTGRRQ